MMPFNRRKWLIYCLIGFWMTAAGTARAADGTPAPPSAPSAQEAPAIEEDQGSPPAAPPPAAETRPAVKPPSRPPTKPRPLKRFEPSEEIHVDKAVDFPADI